MTTKEMVDHGVTWGGKREFRIFCSQPVSGSGDLPLDPYVLGVWRGEGTSLAGSITSGDNYIFEKIQNRGYQVGGNL